MLVILGARDSYYWCRWYVEGCFPLGPDIIVHGTGGTVEHVSGLPMHGCGEGEFCFVGTPGTGLVGQSRPRAQEGPG